jgi:hypothetical protein
MKKFLLYLFLCTPLSLMAQRKASTPPMAFDMDATRLPANINLVPGSLEFKDENNDQTIGANEQCVIRFQISNTGLGDGAGCIARISAEGNIKGLTYSSTSLPIIKHNENMWVEFPIISDRYTEDGVARFKMEIYEPHGLGTGDIFLDVPTYHFVSPMIKVTDYRILGDKSTLQRKEKFTLQVLVKNVDYGVANDVGVKITIPTGVTLLSDNNALRVDQLLPNEEMIIEYDLIAAVNAPEKLDFLVSLSEKYRLYAENRQIALRLDEKIFSYSDKIISTRQEVEITEGTLTSEVDKNIPVANKKNTNTIAVIIANEKYQSVASVPYAINDGNIFREYCVKTLGMPEKQVKYVPNATGNQIKAQVNWLQNICEAFEDAQVIFYYAGHGIPDESSRTAYLLPVDGIGTDISTGYKLDDLYSALGNIPTKNVTVFMDACFSGSKREQGMLASARGVAIKARSGMPQGNMVVFSAAQGDETAYPNNEEKHGMFTYFLLKKLQDTKGDVTLYELGEYIKTNVSQQSILLNGKSQTPCVTPSASLDASWREWKLR